MNINHSQKSSAVSLVSAAVVAAFMLQSGCGPAPEAGNPQPPSPASQAAADPGAGPTDETQVNVAADSNAELPAAPSKIELNVFWDAALAGNLELVGEAIESGVKVDAVDDQNRTALMLAAFNGHTEVAKLLLEKGAVVDHLDAVGRTALMFAATGANSETVELLIAAGATIDTADQGEGFTALMHAAAEGQAKVVEVLLKHNADPSIKDNDGDTAKDFASRNGHRDVIRQLIQ